MGPGSPPARGREGGANPYPRPRGGPCGDRPRPPSRPLPRPPAPRSCKGVSTFFLCSPAPKVSLYP